MWDIFINRDVKSHYYAMKQILAPYSSMLAIKNLQLKYEKKICEIAKFAKKGKVEREFIEKSKMDGGARVFALIFVLSRFENSALWTSEDSSAINALFDFCKRELLKYKECAQEIFWKILYLDKEDFYKEVVEK